MLITITVRDIRIRQNCFSSDLISGYSVNEIVVAILCHKIKQCTPNISSISLVHERFRNAMDCKSNEPSYIIITFQSIYIQSIYTQYSSYCSVWNSLAIN